MTYQVLARKWRPQTFEAVVGQEAVTRTLRNALQSDRVAHAYLFTGPRGVGKTTTARLLAKALGCTARQGPEACGECPACRDFVSGAPVDVMEIDAATNTHADDIRTLCENVKYAPARSRYKVYIVDEVHMLSKHAFNAFLKTLEEPPPHVVFILATTEPRQIPATVLSRCQRFDFRPIPPDLLARSLGEVLAREGVAFDPGALPMLVRAAEGSLRDALSLTDAAIAYGEGKLDEATVARLLGSSAPAQVRAFVAALLARDGAAALTVIDQAAAAGEDLPALARDALELARRLLVLRVAPGTTFADLTAAEAKELSAQAEGVGVDELIYLLRAFVEADGEMRRSPLPRVELEIAAVRVTRRPQPQALDRLIAKVEEALEQLGSAGPAPARAGAVQESLLGASAPASPVRTAGPPPVASPGASASPRAPAPVPVAASARPAPGPPPVSGGSSVLAARPVAERADLEAPAGAPAAAGDPMTERWALVVAEVMRKRALLGTVLQHATPVGLAAGVLTVSLAGSPFHRDLLANQANRDLINQALQQHVPGARRIHVDEESPAQADAVSHPAVRAVVEAFQGEIVAVRPRVPGEGDSQ